MDKDKRIKELEQSNAALRERLNSQQTTIETWASVNKGRENTIVNLNHKLAQQEAITAWTMGFE